MRRACLWHKSGATVAGAGMQGANGDRGDRLPAAPAVLIGRLRRAGVGDLAALVDLKRRRLRQIRGAHRRDGHHAWVIDRPAGADLLAALVLRREPACLLVCSVAVAPAVQGQGLGRALLGFAETEALRAGCLAVRLFTNERFTENLALYHRLGYRETGRDADHDRTRIHLHKALDDGRPKLE